MNRRYIKIGIFLIVAAILCTVVYFSKQYFDSNYNSHQAVESNLNLYRIKMKEKQEAEAQGINAQIVKEGQVEAHSQATQVVEPIEPSNTATPTPVKDAKPEVKTEATLTASKPITKQEVAKQVEPVTQGIKPKAEAKQVEPTPIKDNSKLTKPKTLEEKPTVTQAVMKNPEFQTFVIQVGAFSTKEEAELMKSRVSKIPAVSKFRVEVKHFPEKNLFKVLVEYFESAESAKQVCGELKQNNVQCFATKI
jgi:cell division protein FtsN